MKREVWMRGGTRLAAAALLGAALFWAPGLSAQPSGSTTVQPDSPRLSLRPSPRPEAKAEVRKLSYELSFGEGAPYSRQFPALDRLPYRRKLQVTREVLDDVARIALSETRSQRVGLVYGPGGWGQYPVQPSAQMDLQGTEQEARTAMRVIGYLAEQTAVIASRKSAAGRTVAYQILQQNGREMADPEVVERYWKRLGELAPKLCVGFLPLDAGGRPGLRIVDSDGAWTAADYAAFEAAIQTAARELGLSVTAQRLRVDVVVVANDWKRYPDGRQYLVGLTSTRGLRLRRKLMEEYRPRVTRRIRLSLKSAAS
jgi:hypothetical protein